jgi:hypothetical protein
MTPDPRGQALLVAQEPKHEMLSADPVVAKRARFLGRKYNDLAGVIGEPLEHRASVQPYRRGYSPAGTGLAGSIAPVRRAGRRSYARSKARRR